MDVEQVLLRMAIALGLGLLVGLQRERKGDELAGIRTFGLITLAGAMAAAISVQIANYWLLAAGTLSVALMMAVGHFRAQVTGGKPSGLTTELAAVLMFMLGAYVAIGEVSVGIVAGGSVALLLYWKGPLHNFVNRMGERDVQSVMQFVLIALVILPVLPRGSMGPYNAFNPFSTWLVVVLVVGVSLAGYVLYRMLPRVGAVLGGAVGGLISSTATTVSYARRTRSAPESSSISAVAIMLANSVSFVRVVVLVALFAPTAFQAMRVPLISFSIVLAALSGVAWLVGGRTHVAMAAQKNPAELTAALVFGGLYALVKLATAWGTATFGAGSLFVIAIISGLTDMDAITLSTAEMATNAQIDASVAWRVIITACLANLAFKYGCVVVLGAGPLVRRISWLFGLTLAGGLALLLFFQF